MTPRLSDCLSLIHVFQLQFHCLEVTIYWLCLPISLYYLHCTALPFLCLSDTLYLPQTQSKLSDTLCAPSLTLFVSFWLSPCVSKTLTSPLNMDLMLFKPTEMFCCCFCVRKTFLQIFCKFLIQHCKLECKCTKLLQIFCKSLSFSNLFSPK